MATLTDDLLLQVLRACERLTPAPLYAATFAADSGLDRRILDEALDHLRLRGLVRLTDWVQGNGQGHALTSQGALVLQNPGLLQRAAAEISSERPPPPDRAALPWQRGEAIRNALVDPVRPVVSMTLLGLNILVFVVGLALAWQQGSLNAYFGSGDPQVWAIQKDLGSLTPADVVARNEWWRLLAHAFVHGGIIHLLMNMYALYVLGPLLETMWGSARFLVLYLVAALAGGAAVVQTMRAGPTVGASGALCGLLASMAVWVYLNRNYLPRNIVSSWQRALFTNLILMVFISTLPGVSWQGHLGGAVGGALVSVPLNYHRFGSGWQKLLGLAGMAAVPAFAIGMVAIQMGSSGESVQVQRYLYAPFRVAEEKAATAFNNHAVPLMRAWGDDIPQARLDLDRQAVQEVQQELQHTLQVFDEAGPFREKGVANTVRLARAYLEEWSKYYALFAKTIAAPPPWTADHLGALAKEAENIARAQRPLANTTLLPAVYYVKKAQD